MANLRFRQSSPATTIWGRYQIALTVACIGFLCTAVAAQAIIERNKRGIERALRDKVEQTLIVLENRLRLYEQGLAGTRAMVAAVGAEAISRSTFQRYVNNRDMDREFPGARGFGLIRRVEPPDEPQFLDMARSDGWPQFSIRQLQSHNHTRYVIVYIEPVARNKQAVGLDIGSEENRRRAAETAMRTGMPTLTGPITLVQTATKSKQSFLFLLPVYRGNTAPVNVAQRLERAEGWAYAPLGMDEVLGDLKVSADQARLLLQDVTDAQQVETFYQSTTQDPAGKSIGAYSLDRSIYGRTWRATLVAYPKFASGLQQTSPWVVALAGGLFSVVGATLMQTVATIRRRRFELAATKARLAAIVEGAPDAIISQTPDGVVLSWNRGAELLFGFSAEQVIGRRLAPLIVPHEKLAEEEQMMATIGSGQSISALETRRLHKSGALIDISVAAAPIFDDFGAVVATSTTVRDMSHIKAIESELHHLNHALEQQVMQRTSELETARRTLRTVLDAVPAIIGYWDRDLINRVANNAYHDWFGLTHGSMPGMSMSEVLGDTLFASMRVRVEAVLRGVPQVFEGSLITGNGSMRHVLEHYLPDVIDGNVRGFYVVALDVSDLVESRSQLAAALRDNEILLGVINEHMLYSVTDTAGNIIEVNDNFCRAHGISRDEVIGCNHRRFNSGTHPPTFWKSLWHALALGQSWRGEICNRATDGSLHWFDTVVVPHLDDKGRPERYLALRIDITERKVIDAEIGRLNNLLRSVLASASEVSIIATDLAGVITVFNSGAELMLGYSAQEMVGLRTPACIHQEQEIQARGAELQARFGLPIEGFRVFVHVAELEGAERRNWTYVRKDGSTLTVSLVVTAIRDAYGSVIGYLGIASDITVSEQQKRDLTAARDQLSVAAEVAELGIWTWTLKDNRLDWNWRMFELYDQPAELAGAGLNYEHWRMRVHPEDIEATAAQLNAAVAGQGTYNPIFRVVRRDGSVRVVQAAASVERNASGQAISVTGINLDITERREIEARLLQAKILAEQANTAKGHFLANMSHEIRTPLNGVLGMLKLLERSSLEPRQHDFVTKAHAAANSLLALLNDILDYSKIEANKIEIEAAAFDLEELLRDIGVVLTGSYAKKEDVEVIYEVDPTLPRCIVGDRLRLQQVLLNLAGNAIKFTDRGHVVVSVNARERRSGSVQLRFSVSDTGVGISEEQQQRIFEGFTQAESSTSRRYGGTGLGLTISRRLVQLMGGELRVDSRINLGSCFWFELELPISEPAPIARAIDHLRILVVDDNHVVGDILVEMLKGLGWEADYVDGGIAAVNQVCANIAVRKHYDLLLMDWRMPDIDGVTAANMVRAAYNGSKPPVVIMVTAYARDILAEIAGQGDPPFADFLTKPATPLQLLDAVQRAFKGTVAENYRVEQHLPQRLAGLRLLLVEDNALNRQVAAELLRGEGAEVTLAEGGVAGVAIATAARPGFDVIIMDVQMPDLDGMQATQRLRADPHTCTTPVIAMTANASAEDRLQCLRAGMNEHIGKPFDLDEVITKLLACKGQPVAHDPVAEQKPSAMANEAGEAEQLLVPLATLLKRFDHRIEIYRSALANFAPECRRILDALELLDARASANEAGALLHALKGVAATLGASALARLAADLETQAQSQAQLPAPQLLSGERLSRLRELFDRSATQMQLDFNALGKHAEKRTVMDSDVEWLPLLLALDQSLASGNLQAVEQAQQLVAIVSGRRRLQVLRLAEQISELHFDAARQEVQQLLKEHFDAKPLD